MIADQLAPLLAVGGDPAQAIPIGAHNEATPLSNAVSVPTPVRLPNNGRDGATEAAA